jgi:hypothetical protein
MLSFIFITPDVIKQKYLVLNHCLLVLYSLKSLIDGNIFIQSLAAKGYELVSGGTDNHLVLVNLKNKVREKMCFKLHVLLVWTWGYQF